MKTSNLIILILLVCIPVFLLTYNRLLKEQFLAGNFSSDRFDPETLKTRKELPAFHHVVIDGILRSKNRDVLSMNIPWFVKSNAQHSSAEIKYSKGWEEIVHTSVRNDTLFVSLRKEKISDAVVNQLLRWPREIELTLPPIHSFTMINGKGYFEGSNITNAVTLIGKDHASMAVNSTNLTAIEIMLRDDSTVKFEDNNQIQHLEYTLYDQSLFSVSDRTNIAQFLPVYVDSLSRISITARAKELQTQMAKVMGTSRE